MSLLLLPPRHRPPRLWHKEMELLSIDLIQILMPEVVQRKGGRRCFAISLSLADGIQDLQLAQRRPFTGEGTRCRLWKTHLAKRGRDQRPPDFRRMAHLGGLRNAQSSLCNYMFCSFFSTGPSSASVVLPSSANFAKEKRVNK